jgi:monovalent cation:proton antiporter-2 (CPA2) family protein
MTPHAEEIPYLHEIVIFLTAAGIVIPFMHRFRIAPVLGYLIIGALIGPFGLALFADNLPVLRYATITDLDGVRVVADLGVVLLLFVIGLELSLKRLWEMRRLVFGLGSAQILISGTIIGLAAWGFGNSPAAAIVLGACLALSSTAMVMEILTSRRELGSTVGRSSFAILLMQDLAVVPILFLVGVLGAQSGDGLLGQVAIALGKAVVTILAIGVVGRLVLRPLYRLAATASSRELFMSITLLVVISTAAITAAAGLSMALGAFLAGLLLAETEYRHEIEVDIEPFKGLLMGLFFMSVGMGIDFRLVMAEGAWIIASVAGLIVLKALVTGLLCLAYGLPKGAAAETGLLLGQGGEFAFVVVGLAMTMGLVAGPAGQFMLIVASLSMMVTPLIAMLGKRIAATVQEREAGAGDAPADVSGHVIIAGFGRVGRMVAGLLDAEGIPWLAIDRDAQAVSRLRKEGCQVLYGHADRMELLRRANAASAQAIVITMNDRVAASHTVIAVRRAWPDIPVIVRAHDAATAAEYLKCGASEAVPETLEASLQLGGRVLARLGAPADVVGRRIDEARQAAE